MWFCLEVMKAPSLFLHDFRSTQYAWIKHYGLDPWKQSICEPNLLFSYDRVRRWARHTTGNERTSSEHFKARYIRCDVKLHPGVVRLWGYSRGKWARAQRKYPDGWYGLYAGRWKVRFFRNGKICRVQVYLICCFVYVALEKSGDDVMVNHHKYAGSSQLNQPLKAGWPILRSEKMSKAGSRAVDSVR